jgi:hypothetical protein
MSLVRASIRCVYRSGELPSMWMAMMLDRLCLTLSQKCVFVYGFISAQGCGLKRDKGIWWMPWRVKAMKDVALCDKPRGDGSNL